MNLATPIDFSAFIMHRLKIDNMTQEVLTGPTYDLIKGTCKSVVELEYHLEEVFKATNDRLDWHNLEGKPYPHDLSNAFRGSSSQKYITSITKTKAVDYGQVKWIEDKLANLNLEERYALNVALRMYTRCIVNQKRVEDLQLGVKSYQKKINLIKPDTSHSDLRRMTAYTTYPNIQGIIYEDELNRNRLMRTDELHKFSDGTLNHVRTTLNDIGIGLRLTTCQRESGVNKTSKELV
nr:hypothetical protein [Tanacetum cinerariifolium]